MIEVKNVTKKYGKAVAVENISFTINDGEIVGLLGPNGAGKSTLANVILNNPRYDKKDGEILFEGENINDLKTDEIAKRGIFMSFQSPEEIPGISVMNFLKYARHNITGEPVKIFSFKE